MAPLSIQSGVKYAKTLLPETLVKSVSTVQTTISRHILPSAQPRCFKVCNYSRRRRRGLVASSLDELLEQVKGGEWTVPSQCEAAVAVARVFVLSCHFLTLVLEEDGTVVDSEEFFQSLPNNTSLMVLEKGEMWTKNKFFPSFRQPKRNGIAKLSFDLYKLDPRDFLCCCAIKATLYEMYTVSYDFKCTRVKHVFKLLLRCFTSLTRVSGQLLLYTSSSLLPFTGEDDC